MTGAALALALAILVAPTSPRQRLVALHVVEARRRRPPVLACVVLVGTALLTLMPVPMMVTAVVVAVTVVVRRRRRVGQRRRAEESATLQGALDILVGELRVGIHPVAAFSVAAAEVDGSVAESLRAVAARARLGADVAAGLRSVAARSMVPAHWERLAVCWQLAQPRVWRSPH